MMFLSPFIPCSSNDRQNRNACHIQTCFSRCTSIDCSCLSLHRPRIFDFAVTTRTSSQLLYRAAAGRSTTTDDIRMKYYRNLSFKNSRHSFRLCQLQLKMCKMSNSADFTLIYSRSLAKPKISKLVNLN